MTLKKALISLCFLLSLHCLIAQDSIPTPIDTLESIVNKSNKAYDAYNYKDAIRYGAALVEKGKEYHHDYYTFLGYDMLGGIYAEMEDSVRGRIYSEKALEIARSTKADSLIAWGTLNLGILYSDNPKTYQKAIQLFEESIAINTENNAWNQVYLTHINLIWTYLDNKKLDKAYTLLNRAKSIAEKAEVDSMNEQYIELLTGRYYLAKKEYTTAKKKLESSAKRADKDSITDLGIEAYYYLTQMFDRTNDYQSAFESLKAYNAYRKKAFTKEKIEETVKARAEFNLEQAQKDLNTALREKEYSDELISKSKSLTAILIAATIILFLALLGFYLFFNTRKKFIGQLKTKNKELNLAKEKAEKLSKVKTRFLSTVSHELRTPLYGIIGISTLLEQDKNLKAYEEDIGSLKFSADYLLALVNDVLLLSKVDAEAIRLSQNPFELDILIQNIVRSFEFSLKNNRNKLHLEIDQNVPNSVIGDPIRLSQILINLIGNAVKFTQDGNIWLKLDFIKVSNNGSYKIHFSVKDDGPGIPMDKQKEIFKEFSQIENDNHNHNYKGTGLGLTIVKKLLKLHNSKIDLKSKPGEGSEFSFVLPMRKNTDQAKKRSDQKSKERGIEDGSIDPNLHILIVDDNKINQRVTQKILGKYHFKSSLANDGEQAIAMNRSQKFDLILMDINMPKINGIEAAKKIRKSDKKTPIIALTAVELDEMRNEIFDSGISDIIHKPYDVQEFLKTILKHLPGKPVDKV